MYVFINERLFVCMYLRLHVCMHACMTEFNFVNMYVCMYEKILSAGDIRLGSPTKPAEASSSSSSSSGSGNRRLSHTDIFPSLLSKMVMKLCIEHPHHTLPQLFALAHERDIGAQVQLRPLSKKCVCMYVCMYLEYLALFCVGLMYVLYV
jgi:hypothetical protein